MLALVKSRKGRKRKSGKRDRSGHLREKKPDDRLRVGLQPHRIALAPELRMSEKAECPLGRLWLSKRITEQQLEAGRLYRVCVGAYLAMINAPNALAGAGRGYDCMGCGLHEQDQCECLRRKRVYLGAYGALANAGISAVLAVDRAAVEEKDLGEGHIPDLRLGLNALSSYWGLTRHGKT